MVTTTCDSLKSLQSAKVKLDGLAEGIELLERAVEYDDWYTGPPRRPARYLEQELSKLQAALTEAVERQAQLTSRYGGELSQFIQATQVLWSREDEERFQTYLKQWKKDLEPKELKIVRGLWKIFGAKAAEAMTGGIPIDWDAAAGMASEMLKK